MRLPSRPLTYLLLSTIVLASVAAACDETIAPTPHGPAVADDGPLEPPPPAGGQQLTTTPYTLEGGEERYLCFTFRSPAHDVGITRVDNLDGELVHHVVLFEALAPEPEGSFECNVIYKPTWIPVWLAAKGTDDLALPEGVAFRIKPNTQYVAQYHLFNVRPKPVTERSALNLTYAEDVAAFEPANVLIVGSLSLSIPKDAKGFTQTPECVAERELNVFAGLPHMHLLGKRIALETGPAGALEQRFVVDPWDFDNQPFARLDTVIQAGDTVRASCTWDNDTGHDVGFGESSHNEMCFFLVYAWPMESFGVCGI